MNVAVKTNDELYLGYVNIAKIYRKKKIEDVKVW